MPLDTGAIHNIDIPQPPADAPIQFFDLKAQQALIRKRVEARFTTILDHGRHIGGPEVDELEQKLCDFTGAADAVAVGSGTQALVMPLIALGYGHGDAVFIPAFTYNATANAVLLAGATPVFVDVDPETFNMCPKHLEKQILAVKARRDLRARAIIPVDLYGMPADYDAITQIADSYGLRIGRRRRAGLWWSSAWQMGWRDRRDHCDVILSNQITWRIWRRRRDHDHRQIIRRRSTIDSVAWN